MPLRMTGLISNMDTESIVKELMKAQSAKKTKVENKKTKLEWTQEKWADMNSKIYKLYTDYASKLKLTTAYKTKSAVSSNTGVANITAGSAAVDGAYSMTVESVASAQFITGAKIDDSVLTEGLTKTTKLSNLDSSLVGTEITVTSGGKTSVIRIGTDTTMQQLTEKFSEAGINANYDVNQKRLFLSSKNSGEENAFSITTSISTASENSARQALEAAVHYQSLSTADKAVVDNAFQGLRKDSATAEYQNAVTALEKLAEKSAASSTASAATAFVGAVYAQQLARDDSKLATYTDIASKVYYELDEEGNATEQIKPSVAEGIKTSLRNKATEEAKKLNASYTTEDVDTQYRILLNKELGLDEGDTSDLATKESQFVENQVTAGMEKTIMEQLHADVKTMLESEDGKALVEQYQTNGVTQSDLEAMAMENGVVNQDKLDGLIDTYGLVTSESLADTTTEYLQNTSNAISAYATQASTGMQSDSNALMSLGLTNIVDGEKSYSTAGMTEEEIAAFENKVNDIAAIQAKDSVIYMNGARLTGTTSTVSVNGLDIALSDTTEAGETVTFTVANDVDAVYKTVKDFVTQYNALLKEMNEAYYADSARGYEPLSDEDKEAMTDDQIKLWEDKIKKSLLRRDDQLSGVMTSLRDAMGSSVEVDGKKYSLASLGIMTSVDYSEKGLLHIYGDSTDSTYMDKDDKLKALLATDPELVTDIMTGIVGGLADSMNKKMASNTLSSALTFYNDKQMSKDLKAYKEDISEWEDRLADMEDAYYKQFTAMEKAMANLNSQQSSLASMLG